MTNEENREWLAEQRLWNLYRQFAPRGHYTLRVLCEKRDEIIAAATPLPRELGDRLAHVAKVLAKSFEEDYIAEVCDSPIGLMEVDSEDYVDYVRDMTTEEFLHQQLQYHLAYKDDITARYF